ncbi:MAG: energy-coupling factor transporter transmembrane protein EcfT [Clostridia bacterium]|nr:energy-coupling factor transporter transmembrane protein EcfT [Clostridia bacterium]
MLKDITLGQFFPGESFMHKLDPRMKLILTVLYVVNLFLVPDFWGFLIVGALMLLVIVFSGISLKVVLRGMRPILFVVVFTAFFNIFYGGGAPLFPDIGWLSWLKTEGVKNAAFMIIRIVLLIMGTSYLTYTTSPVMLTDAIERLFSPLKVFRLPVHELAMMMTIALRFIPTLIDETDKIINAQKARGADFETGNIVRRAKSLVPILIPLLISAFRRAEELADAMECRCYHGGKGRTRYKVYHFGWRDWFALFLMAASMAGVILLMIF